ISGPPGVSKTLIVEAMLEYLIRLLYIFARELGTTTDALKKKLSLIFKIVTYWKATLLLNKADVFVEQRATNNIHRNALICVLVRT
ncbi:uncharacterized protein K441DRAFT_575083, partial [Cenococcum geophilum 1.58]|uniref:uncharacterized protein n=1 Tax=Cenococcum geophilum 1.58 TaxID=794803 RepID=UPI00358FB7EB